MDGLLAVATTLVGFGGYLYVFGGIELYLSFDDAGLPAGDAIDVFASRRFLTVGLFVFGVVLLLTVISLIVAAFVMRVFPSVRPAKESSRLRTAQLAAGSFAAWTVLITVGAPLIKPFHLRLARVLTVDHKCVQGPYLSTDAVGAHLVDGRHKRLLSLPAADVASVVLGPAPEVQNSSILFKSATACSTLNELNAANW